MNFVFVIPTLNILHIVNREATDFRLAPCNFHTDGLSIRALSLITLQSSDDDVGTFLELI